MATSLFHVVTPMLPEPNGVNTKAQDNSGAASVILGATSNRDSKKAVHLGFYCDGDGCVSKGLESIVGSRYECVSCYKLKFIHNLCDSCYEKYPFKSADQEGKMQSTVSSTVISPSCTRSGDPTALVSTVPVVDYSHLVTQNDDDLVATKANIAEHFFRRFEECSGSDAAEKRARDHQAILKNSIRAKVAYLRQFDHLNFIFGILLLYPLGLINYCLHGCFGRLVNIPKEVQESQLNSKSWWYRLLRPSVQYDKYFAQFRIMHIGICLLWNVVVIWAISTNLMVNGTAWMFYWTFTWEVTFVQMMATQAQVHARRDERNDACGYIGYVLRDLLLEVGMGFCFIMHDMVYVLDRNKLSYYCDYQCRIKRPAVSDLFCFPLPTTKHESQHRSENGQNESKCNAQSHCRVHLTRLFRPADVEKSLETWQYLPRLVVVLFSIVYVMAISIDSRLLISTLGNAVMLPQLTDYSIKDTTMTPACLAGSASDVARLQFSLLVDPVPTVAKGLSVYTVSFNCTNDTSVVVLTASLEKLWYADLVETTTESFSIQLQPDHAFVAAIVLIPELPCSSVSDIQLWTNQMDPQFIEHLQHFPFNVDERHFHSLTSTTFGTVVIALVIFVIMIRVLVLFTNVEQICDVWNAFSVLNNKDGGVWVPDYKARLPIDFKLVENCLTWFEFRSQLIDITNVNINTFIPYMTLSLVQFIVSLVWICWYVVLGNAPIPGFLFLICTCVSALMVLVAFYPLFTIWQIQYSHIALITGKCFEVEALRCNDTESENDRERTTRVLIQIRTSLELNDGRLKVLGMELSPGFLRTVGTFAVSGISFLLGGQLTYHVSEA